jgi:hypothetical protein
VPADGSERLAEIRALTEVTVAVAGNPVED